MVSKKRADYFCSNGQVRFQQCVQTTSMDHPTDLDWSKHPDLAASAGWVFKTKRFLSPVDIPVLILKVWQENPEAGKVFTDSCLGYAQVRAIFSTQGG